MPNSRMPKLLALGLLAALALQAAATELRGRVDGVHPYAPYPFPLGGARVQLYVFTPQGPRPFVYTYTGGDGMYYFTGIAPGNYTLQVNGVLNFPLTVYPVPQQDIPPILWR